MSFDIEFLNIRQDSIAHVRFVSPYIEFKRHWLRLEEKYRPVNNCPDDCPLCEREKPHQRWAAVVIAEEMIRGPSGFKVFEFGTYVKRQIDTYYYNNPEKFVLGDPNNDLEWGIERKHDGRYTRYIAHPYEKADVLSVEQREEASFYYNKMEAAYPPLTKVDVLNIMRGVIPDYKKNMIRKLKKKYPKNRWTALEID